VDADGGKFYWTQKGGDNTGLGRIFRAGIQVPKGQLAGNRTDIELLYHNLPEPIDRTSIWRIGRCTGPTAGTRRAETR